MASVLIDNLTKEDIEFMYSFLHFFNSNMRVITSGSNIGNYYAHCNITPSQKRVLYSIVEKMNSNQLKQI